MAGIGFQLKNLFEKEGLIANVKAYINSTLVTIGPTVICIITITSLNFLLKYLGVSIAEIELLQASIMYSFIFSLILSSGFCMILSRYIADKLYEKNLNDIPSSSYGAISLAAIVAGIVGLVFYAISPLDIVYKFFAYILFVQLTVQSVISAYVSALKNYKKISNSFIIGFLVGMISSIIMYYLTNIYLILNMLISFNIWFGIVNLILFNEIQRYFSVKSKKYFEFIGYFKKHSLIFLTNTFWILGLYIHNFIIWCVDRANYLVGNTYIYAPSYDIPAFYAFLSIMPTLVIFVVKLETEFFSKYSNYFHFINEGASYEDIEGAKRDMKNTLYKELVYIMEIQIFFTLGVIILGINLLQLIGFSSSMIDLFNILCLGYYFAIMSFVIMTILLYYEDKIGALLTTGTFFGTNMIFTTITVFLGEVYYGTGMFISGIITIIVTLNRLRYFINNIDYYVFCKHSSW